MKAIEPDLKQRILDRISQIPIFSTLEMDVGQVGEGYFEVTIPRRVKWDGIFQSLHGGILMTLADSTAAFAILTQTGPDEPMTTTDMNIRFLAPCLSPATAKAKVIKLGRTMCPVSVDIFDAQGALVAVAQVNYMRLGERK
ncbi:MAG: PaaI family thioesterase [Desulfarculaceae bacterium]|jgi:acyl-CoA thioesterase